MNGLEDMRLRLETLLRDVRKTRADMVVMFGKSWTTGAIDAIESDIRDVKAWENLRSEGCECHLTAKRSDRCDRQWIRCNGRLVKTT